MSDYHNRTDIVLNEAIVAALQRTHIDYHINFTCAFKDRPPGLVGFNVCQRGAQRKSNDGADRHARAPQITGGNTNPRGVHTN